MKNTFYAIEIVETGTWAVPKKQWVDSEASTKSLVYPFRVDAFYESRKQARFCARHATTCLGTKCRVVALVVTHKGGVR